MDTIAQWVYFWCWLTVAFWSVEYAGLSQRPLRPVNSQSGRFFHQPLELAFGHQCEVNVGGGVGAIDDIGGTIFDDELDHIDIVLVGARNAQGVFGQLLAFRLIVGKGVLLVTAVFA